MRERFSGNVEWRRITYRQTSWRCRWRLSWRAACKRICVRCWWRGCRPGWTDRNCDSRRSGLLLADSTSRCPANPNNSVYRSNKQIMSIWTRSLSNAFRQFMVYVHINIISELFTSVGKKSNSVISNCTAAMILSSFCIISNKHCQLRDHSIRFTIKGPSSLCVYLAPLRRYGASKTLGSSVWPFGVTWRHRSRDHSTPGGQLHMGGL